MIQRIEDTAGALIFVGGFGWLLAELILWCAR